MGVKKQITAMDDLSFGEKLFIRFGYKKLLKLIDKKYKGKKSLKILDIGCGPGVSADELKKRGIVCGLDNNFDSLISKKRFNKVCGDVMFSPFKDNSFDVVISRSSLGYWKDKDRSFDEILRVLKPGSYFFICDIRKIENRFIKNLLILADIFMVGSLRKVKDTKYAIETRCSVEELKRLFSGRKAELDIKKSGLVYFFVVGKSFA